MPNSAVTIAPAAKPSTPDIADRIFPGPGKGANTIHKVGSAKIHVTKTTGRVANKSKFHAARKKG